MLKAHDNFVNPMQMSFKSTFIRGRESEKIIVASLEKDGHTILFRNMRTLFSEIDIVTLSPKKEIWLIEVKSGAPSVWRTPTSKAQGRRLARAFQHLRVSSSCPLRFHLVHCDFEGRIQWNFDALAQIA